MMTETGEAGFLELEHTADWALRVWAQDLPGLFEQSARGMYTLMEVAFIEGSAVERELDLSAMDTESLLVTFLSELLFIASEQGMAGYDFDLSVFSSRLHARVRLKPFARPRKEIKAVTYHNLAIQDTGHGLVLTIVFDV